MLSDPAFFRAVSSFLSDPVIRLEPSERMQVLNSELDHLRLEYREKGDLRINTFSVDISIN